MIQSRSSIIKRVLQNEITHRICKCHRIPEKFSVNSIVKVSLLRFSLYDEI